MTERVGHGRAEIAVLRGEPMGGYVDRAGGVQGNLHPLEVNAIVVDNADRRFALIVVDLICVNIDLVESVRRRLRDAYAVDQVWLSATHTHASPESGCRPRGEKTESGLAGRVVDACDAAVAAAMDSLRPGSLQSPLRVGVAGVAAIRSSVASDPEIPIDVIAVGRPLVGVLVVVPIHPTVLSAENRLSDPDLVGGIRRAFGAEWRSSGPSPWIVVATGAAGDISTRHHRHSTDLAGVDRLSSTIAGSILDALTLVPHEVEVEHAPTHDAMSWLEQDLPVPAKTATEWERQFATEHDQNHSERTRSVNAQAHRLARQWELVDRSDPVVVPIGAARIGGVDLVAIGGEPFLALGQAIRAAAPRPHHTVVLGYANGYVGYLPDTGGAGCDGYESVISPVSTSGGETVAAAAVALLHRLPTSEFHRRREGTT